MGDLPSGTGTFLFTDIEGGTAFTPATVLWLTAAASGQGDWSLAAASASPVRRSL